jgi:hypothetical protein
MSRRLKQSFRKERERMGQSAQMKGRATGLTASFEHAASVVAVDGASVVRRVQPSLHHPSGDIADIRLPNHTSTSPSL